MDHNDSSATTQTAGEGIQIPDAMLASVEATINAVLALDTEGARRLAPIQGRILLVELAGFGTRIYVVPEESGLLLFSAYDAPPDCTVRGTPAGLLSMALSEHREDVVFGGAVEIDGDNRVAQTLGEVVQGLDIDWEELLSKVTGDTLAHRIGLQARAGRHWAERTGDTVTQDIREYLQEEGRILPGRDEMHAFLTDVDTLRDDVERLEARIARLEAKPRNP